MRDGGFTGRRFYGTARRFYGTVQYSNGLQYSMVLYYCTLLHYLQYSTYCKVLTVQYVPTHSQNSQHKSPLTQLSTYLHRAAMTMTKLKAPRIPTYASTPGFIPHPISPSLLPPPIYPPPRGPMCLLSPFPSLPSLSVCSSTLHATSSSARKTPMHAPTHAPTHPLPNHLRPRLTACTVQYSTVQCCAGCAHKPTAPDSTVHHNTTHAIQSSHSTAQHNTTRPPARSSRE